MSLKNTHARFVAGNATLTVYLRTGKRGLHVAASLKEPGKKAVTGSRQDFEPNGVEGNTDHEVAAQAAFATLKADASAKGWTEKVRPVKKDRVKKDRNAFATIPEANTFTQPASETTEQPASETTEQPASEEPASEEPASEEPKPEADKPKSRRGKK